MRVTDHMTNEMAKNTGLPIYMNNVDGNNKNRLLDALDKKSVEDDFDSISARDNKKTKEIKKAADKMNELVGVFDEEREEAKLYEEARKDGDLSEIVKKTKSFATQFNSLLKSLEGDNGGLFELYKTELKNASLDLRDSFILMGISFDKNGFMSVDDDKLKAIDINEFKNNMDIFSHKVGFLSGRISENANAIEESLSNRYDAMGNMFSQGTSMYDFWG